MLTTDELQTYGWQMWVPDLGREGQEKLKQGSVLVSRVGGIGGLVAYQLAAAGIGKLILAHAGVVQPSDLNRQLLVTHDWIGKRRIESIERRLKELNPRLEIRAVDQNVDDSNADALVSQADVVVDCAPLFPERFAMNRAAVNQRKPIIECAMYEMEAQITTIIPGKTPCLRCIYPEDPTTWKREFPVIGAVSGSVGCLGAVEAIKLIGGFGESLLGRMLRYDLRDMTFQTFSIERRPNCRVCGSIAV
jgi:molybdopterin/thiamine biosynthesis adenylyltransferase